MLLVSGCDATQPAAPQSETSDWRGDLRAFAQQLEARHINLYHTLPAADFHAEIDRLEAAGEGLSTAQKRVALMRLARRVGDGHTAVPLWWEDVRLFPFDVTLVGDTVLVTGTGQAHRDLLGASLVSVNEISVSDIRAQLAPIVPFAENAHSLRVRTGRYFLVEDLLAGLSLLDAGAPAQLTFQQGEGMRVIETSALDQGAYEDAIVHRLSPRQAEAYFKRRGGTDTLWFGDRGDSNTIYIQFDQYPSADTMDAFGRAVLKHMNTRGSQHLIIDLRGNFGGDFFTGLILASYLNLADSIDWEEGVYVLIGSQTFSAAMSNAAQFRQILNATLVGQPTGGRPCGYQDMGQFELPSSALVVTYSKRRFCFIDTDEDAVMPDQLIEVQAEDFLAQRDRALDWVLEDIAARAERRDD